MSRMQPSVETTVLHVSWRHKALLLAGALIGAGIGAALAVQLPPVYEATAQVLIVRKRPDVVTGMDTRQLSGEEYVAPAQELLKSALILERAIRTKELRSMETFTEQEDVLDALGKSLTVIPAKSSTGQPHVFKLAFRSVVQDDCPVVLTAILDSFKDFIDKKYQTVSTDTVELIIREKESLQRELAAKEAAYRQFREISPLASRGKDGLDTRQETSNIIQAQRSALLLRRVEIEGQLAAVENALKEGRNREAVVAMLVEFTGKGSPGESLRDKQVALQEQLFPLLIEERKLLDVHGAKHPEVIAVRRRIEAARGLLLLPPTAWKAASDDGNASRSGTERTAANPGTVDPVDIHLQMLKQKLQQIKASDESLAKVFQTVHDEARRLSVFEIQDESFRTSIALSKQMYEALVRRLSDVSLIRNVGGYEVDAIETPSIGRKVAPSLRLFALLGGVLGGLLALALAYRAESRRQISDDETTLASRVIATKADLENGKGNHRSPAPHPSAALAAVEPRVALTSTP